MSSGGTFKIIANDGKSDRMILASALLKHRIHDLILQRMREGKQDTVPTLVDIEKTHILYVNAHFKPFAAIGFEYQKVKPQTGSTTFGGSVTFSIPQYGDFIHDIVVRANIGTVSANVGSFNPSSVMDDGQTMYDVTGGYLAIYEDTPSTVYYRNFVRYCEYPGARLFSKVSFDVNGNPLDSYTDETEVMLSKFAIAPNKQAGYDRLMGQQVPLTGYRTVKPSLVTDNNYLSSVSSSRTPQNTLGAWQTGSTGQTPNQIALVGYASSGTTYSGVSIPNIPAFIPNDHNGDDVTFSYRAFANALNSSTQGPQVVPIYLNPDSSTVSQYQYELTQEKVSIVNGYQTPKPIQPPLEIWDRLNFWFSTDVRLSVASVSIPFGQRFITLEISSFDNLCYEYPSLRVYTPGKIFDSTPARAPSISTYYTQNGIDSPDIDLEMYVNNIFLNPEIHDIYIKRIGFSLIRVFRRQTTRVNTETDDILLNNLKWPIEYMYVGVRPKFNITNPTVGASGTVGTGNWETWHDWHYMNRQVTAQTVNDSIVGSGSWPTNELTITSANLTFSSAPGINLAGQYKSTGTSTDTIELSVSGTEDVISSDITFTEAPTVTPTGEYSFDAADAPGTVTLQAGVDTVSIVAGQVWGMNGGDVSYWTPVATIDRLSLTSHGIVIYDQLRDTFYNQYIPYHYGGANMNTPVDDQGVFLVNMALFPRTYQPSGHINISRARETYLNIQSHYITSTSPCDVIVVAVAINFLLISDGSAMLRYST